MTAIHDLLDREADLVVTGRQIDRLFGDKVCERALAELSMRTLGHPESYDEDTAEAAGVATYAAYVDQVAEVIFAADAEVDEMGPCMSWGSGGHARRPSLDERELRADVTATLEGMR